ncbi:MAG: hypothetical protein BWX86_00310 [Verrucomicrobia bacterium ADurb.Bin122]|nr:MAG: hypothetical protein BWX86_00310 [Verrucomicrobia bacterium ADurb.Bin122]
MAAGIAAETSCGCEPTARSTTSDGATDRSSCAASASRSARSKPPCSASPAWHKLRCARRARHSSPTSNPPTKLGPYLKRCDAPSATFSRRTWCLRIAMSFRGCRAARAGKSICAASRNRPPVPPHTARPRAFRSPPAPSPASPARGLPCSVRARRPVSTTTFSTSADTRSCSCVSRSASAPKRAPRSPCWNCSGIPPSAAKPRSSTKTRSRSPQRPSALRCRRLASPMAPSRSSAWPDVSRRRRASRSSGETCAPGATVSRSSRARSCLPPACPPSWPTDPTTCPQTACWNTSTASTRSSSASPRARPR